MQGQQDRAGAVKLIQRFFDFFQLLPGKFVRLEVIRADSVYFSRAAASESMLSAMIFGPRSSFFTVPWMITGSVEERISSQPA